jgi:hypothetical protein
MRAKHWACGLAFLWCAVGPVEADDARTAYPGMAPLAQYLSASAAEEIALAKSAAPASISANADVLTLGSGGYSTAIKGNNGFVCVVVRSWATGFADAQFWNPKLRSPICYNHAAARSVLPTYIEKTGWVLAGVPMTEMIARTRAQLAANKFMLPETGAMSYMMSNQGFLNDTDGHWHPHLMFYLANAEAAAWGANLDGSPMLADRSSIFGKAGSAEPVTTFFLPVKRWSDGTPETMETH